MKTERDDCCDMFKALSVGTRVRIIEILKSKGPMGAKKIATALGVTPAAVSQHLKVLRHAGLVRSERKGYWIPYHIDEQAMAECRDRLSTVCACGHHVSFRMALRRRHGGSLKELERYRAKLEEELRRVKERISELEKG
jgi:DNA-binding transcriptional ArsR family regulator